MKFIPVKGTISKFFEKSKENVESFYAFEDVNYCGLDCCKNIIKMDDKSTGVKTVAYFFDGALVVETEAEFKAKQENGDFNY